MKTLKDYILTEKLKLNAKSKAIEYKYHPKDRHELISLLEQLLKERGKDADLNDIDTSDITDMSLLFDAGLDPHNIDISEWNVSNVKDMGYMFYGCKKFNSDLSKWDVSNVKNMCQMFAYCENFNSNLSNWDVNNVEYMGHMFIGCKNFNSDLSKWNMSKVTNKKHMFIGCTSLKNKNILSWYKE